MEKLKKIKDKIFENKYKILFCIILIVAFITRGYKIAANPVGIHVDEAGMAYDAYCLANYGTDRFLYHLPVYLINFGGGQSALYAYLAAIFVKIMGLSILSIRLPALVVSLVAIICAYLIGKQEKGEKTGLLFMALVTITPWHIMISRWGLDCNLLAPFILISTYLLLRAKGYKGYILAGVSFGITLYTYALSYIIIPCYLALLLVYMLWTKRIKFKQIIVLGIPIFILAIPLMLMILINNGYMEEVNSFISINKLEGYRGNEFDIHSIKKNLNFYRMIFTHDQLEYNATERFGTFYLFSVPLIVLGLGIEINNVFLNIKNKKFDLGTVFLFQFGIVFALMHLVFEPNLNRANAIFIPMIYFMIPAIKCIYKNYKILFGILVCLFAVFFIRFEDFYINDFPVKFAYLKYFESDYLDAINYINSKEELKDKKVHVVSGDAEPYIYTLFLNPISPQEFNEQLHQDTIADDKFSYGKYYFEDASIDEDAIYILKQNDSFTEYLSTFGLEQDEDFEYKTFRVIYKK